LDKAKIEFIFEIVRHLQLFFFIKNLAALSYKICPKSRQTGAKHRFVKVKVKVWRSDGSSNLTCANF